MGSWSKQLEWKTTTLEWKTSTLCNEEMHALSNSDPAVRRYSGSPNPPLIDFKDKQDKNDNDCQSLRKGNVIPQDRWWILVWWMWKAHLKGWDGKNLVMTFRYCTVTRIKHGLVHVPSLDFQCLTIYQNTLENTRGTKELTCDFI